MGVNVVPSHDLSQDLLAFWNAAHFKQPKRWFFCEKKHADTTQNRIYTAYHRTPQVMFGDEGVVSSQDKWSCAIQKVKERAKQNLIFWHKVFGRKHVADCCSSRSRHTRQKHKENWKVDVWGKIQAYHWDSSAYHSSCEQPSSANLIWSEGDKQHCRRPPHKKRTTNESNLVWANTNEV